MSSILKFVIILTILVIPALSNGEMLKCEGHIVNPANNFDKEIIYHIDITIPTKDAEKYILILADKDTGEFKSLLQYNPIVRKTSIKILLSFENGTEIEPNIYECIVLKMPDESNSLHCLIYGYDAWVLRIDTWKKGKPFIFYQYDNLIKGKCR